jgi:hypothetical protein
MKIVGFLRLRLGEKFILSACERGLTEGASFLFPMERILIFD